LPSHFLFLTFFLVFVVGTLVVAWSGNMNFLVPFFGLLLCGYLYLNLFVLKRPFFDFMNWYILYWFLYFYIGYCLNALEPESFARFAAFTTTIRPGMLELSILYSAIYVSLVFGVYSLFSRYPKIRGHIYLQGEDRLLSLAFWVLWLVESYFLLVGIGRMGMNVSRPPFFLFFDIFFRVNPILSAWLFFNSRSKWKFAYPFAVCLLGVLSASKAAILSVGVTYLAYTLIRSGANIKTLLSLKKRMVAAALAGIVSIWLTATVMYPFILAYRRYGDFYQALQVQSDWLQTGYWTSLLERVIGADNFTLLIQSVYVYAEPHVSYFETINIFNFLLPRDFFPDKPLFTITNLYTTRIGGYFGNYDFGLLITDIGGAFYYFGIRGVFIVPVLLGLFYSLAAKMVAKANTRHQSAFYLLFIYTLANPAEMFIEHKIYSFLMGYVALWLLFCASRVFRWYVSPRLHERSGALQK